MDQGKNTVTFKDLYNYQIPYCEKTGSATDRSVHSSSSPNKSKRSRIKINSKRLPQDFFNFGTSKIYNQQLANKLTLSPDRSNRAQASQREKEKEQLKGIWLPNFSDQMLFADEVVMMNDQAEIKKIRGRFTRGILRSQDESNSPTSPLLPFRTIGAMTPNPSSGNTSPAIEPPFQWTFSKDMFSSISTARPHDQKKQYHLKRGGSLKQRNLADNLLTKSCENNEITFIIRSKDKRKMSFGDYNKGETQFPRIFKK